MFGCDRVTARWSMIGVWCLVSAVCCSVVSNVQSYNVHWSNLFIQHVITANEWISFLFYGEGGKDFSLTKIYSVSIHSSNQFEIERLINFGNDDVSYPWLWQIAVFAAWQAHLWWVKIENSENSWIDQIQFDRLFPMKSCNWSLFPNNTSC